MTITTAATALMLFPLLLASAQPMEDVSDGLTGV